VAVHSLLGSHHHDTHQHDHHHHHDDRSPKKKSSRESVNRNIENDGAIAPCCSPDPVQQLQTFQRMASVLENEQHDNVVKEQESEVVIIQNDLDDDNRSHSDQQEEKSSDSSENHVNFDDGDKEKDEKQDDKTAAASDLLDENSESHKKLQKMGLNTALAIGLHNFPEGLATFVAALEDPAVGAVLAIAIAIHNIPEGEEKFEGVVVKANIFISPEISFQIRCKGLCVALPIYYATGNRLKAFLWALLSGASEIVAGLLGWLILANVVTDSTYAILFGLVSGMMVIISIKELLPTAHQYDPQDTVVTYCFIAGMALMALSLVLFKL
jgi:zinc transporter ZupT